MTSAAKSFSDISLSIKGLSIEREERMILQNVNLSAQSGDTVILRGANGAGKTTFLRTLAGLVPASTDAVTIQKDGTIVSQNEVSEHILFVGHKNGIDDAFTVEENLRFWARLYGVSKDRVEPAADAVGLGDALERPARILSAGQKRRLALARALIASKPVWLLDEPTASLDDTSRHLIAAIIEAHCMSGGIALIATHEDLPLATARSFEFKAA